MRADTLLASVTATTGGVCTLYKAASDSIYATYSCSSKDQQQNVTGVISVAPARNATGRTIFGMGPMLCLIGMNTTAAPVAMGSLGTVPVNGIAWSCTADGESSISGNAVWP